MRHDQKHYHLTRLSQNAKALADELRDDREGETSRADNRQERIAKLWTKIREDFEAVATESEAA